MSQKLTKIRMLTQMVRQLSGGLVVSIERGDVAEFPADEAARLVQKGYAAPFTEMPALLATAPVAERK